MVPPWTYFTDSEPYYSSVLIQLTAPNKRKLQARRLDAPHRSLYPLASPKRMR